jgi:hypothetical protein
MLESPPNPRLPKDAAVKVTAAFFLRAGPEEFFFTDSDRNDCSDAAEPQVTV